MSKRLGSGIYRGRPFGGVGFLWRKQFNNRIKIIRSDGSGRCLAKSFNLNNNTLINIVSVFVPYFSTSPSYGGDLGLCLDFILSVPVRVQTIILGVMNFECVKSHAGFVQSQNVFDAYSIHYCDDMCSSYDGSTYNNVSLGHSSFIDHVFISDVLLQFIKRLDMLDSGTNLSDDRALAATFYFKLNSNSALPPHMGRSETNTKYSWRWNKSDT